MRVLKNDFGWSLIDTAPFDEDVMLEVTDGQGEPYRLRNPCRLTASGWGSSSKGTGLVVTPVRWKHTLADAAGRRYQAFSLQFGRQAKNAPPAPSVRNNQGAARADGVGRNCN
jgi:hypothetical protein